MSPPSLSSSSSDVLPHSSSSVGVGGHLLSKLRPRSWWRQSSACTVLSASPKCTKDQQRGDPPCSWPTAIQRVNAAQRHHDGRRCTMTTMAATRMAETASSPTQRRGTTTGASQSQMQFKLQPQSRHPIFMFCPHTARTVLSKYEKFENDQVDVDDNNLPMKPISRRSKYDKSKREKEEGEAEGITTPPPRTATMGTSSNHGATTTSTFKNPCGVRLVKPLKTTTLLRHALTNANGNTWKRQRPLVSRALGGPVARQSKRRAATAAREAALSYLTMKVRCCYSVPSPSPAKLDHGSYFMQITVDVREMALYVATACIVSATLGCRHGERVLWQLRRMFQPTLVPQHGGKTDPTAKSESATMTLDKAVRRAVDSLYQEQQHQRRQLGQRKTQLRRSGCDDDDDDSVSSDSSCDDEGVGPSVAIDDECDCLAWNLLRLLKVPTDSEQDDGGATSSPRRQSLEDGARTYLTYEEVVANVHSSLLAGTQTVATTLCGALAHLSERLNVQEEAELSSETTTSISSNTAKLWTKETLRVLPPVAGLPRVAIGEGDVDLGIPAKCACPIKCGTAGIEGGCSSPGQEEEESDQAATLKLRCDGAQHLVVDLLGLAHAGTRKPVSAERNSSGQTSADGNNVEKSVKESSSWLWNPQNQKHASTCNTAQPWGIGRRKCPAGVLSIDCISAALVALLEFGWTWELAQPEKDSTGPTGKGGWISHVLYRPTLTYPHPIDVTFFSLREEQGTE